MTLDRTKMLTERTIGVSGLVLAIFAPAVFNGYWLNSILTQALILGIGAASLIFLSAYGGMISLAQTGLIGIAGYALANMVTKDVPDHALVAGKPHQRFEPGWHALVHREAHQGSPVHPDRLSHGLQPSHQPIRLGMLLLATHRRSILRSAIRATDWPERWRSPRRCFLPLRRR